MTTSSAQAVLDRIESDEAFALRVKDAGGPEASLALLEVEGFEVTRQELRDAALDRYSDALTPEQVDAVAGGTSSVRAIQEALLRGGRVEGAARAAGGILMV